MFVYKQKMKQLNDYFIRKYLLPNFIHDLAVSGNHTSG